VKFNGVGAVVQQASATQLTVVVPKAAGTGPVTVQTGGLIGTGPVFNFTYTVTVSTLAGNFADGFADGIGTVAQFFRPGGLTADGQGNIYVADSYNHRIRKITPAGLVSTFAGSGTKGYADGTGSASKFDTPYGVAADAPGNIYVADLLNNRIRKITAAGDVSSFAGNGAAGFADGNGSAAQFNSPIGVATDAQGNVYVADYSNNRIRKITSLGTVSTLAGSGMAGFTDGNGSTAKFNSPTELAADAQGNIYVADEFNHRIRKITPAGIVSTLAGSGIAGFADGTGSIAQFNNPFGVATDAQGNVYIADYSNNRIRKITPSGVVSTLAGSGIEGFADGNGSTAKFASPKGITTDAKGNIYVVDIENKIRMITVQ
jgi:sugar lactone lactonase YvrE